MVVVNLTCECADWQSVIFGGYSQWEVHKDEFVCVCVYRVRGHSRLKTFRTCFAMHF